MRILILTPDVKLYATAILMLSCLGCSNIASHLHSRWFSHGQINVVLIHWVVKACIVLFGITVISWQTLFNTPVWFELVSVIPAIFLGIAAVKFEYFVCRKNIRSRSSLLVPQPKRYIYHQPISNATQGIAKHTLITKVNLKNVHEHHSRLDSELKHYSLRDIILVAITEEVIFRGYLWQLCLYFQSKWLSSIALIVTVILFGASHITLGKSQFVSKTFLGATCLLCVLVVHSVIPAIIVHVVFNIYAHKEMMAVHEIKNSGY
jgi:hypothetical protein